jgi:hypothetical protein
MDLGVRVEVGIEGGGNVLVRGSGRFWIVELFG